MSELEKLKRSVTQCAKSVERQWNKFDALDMDDYTKRERQYAMVGTAVMRYAAAQEKYIEALEKALAAKAS